MGKYKIHNGITYLVVRPKDYVLSHKDSLFVACKNGFVVAKQGNFGQEIKPSPSHKNIVSYDHETGEPDWVVKDFSGKPMIISDSTFKTLYRPSNSNSNYYFSRQVPRIALMIQENICFISPWGEMTFADKGDFLIVLSGNDIYRLKSTEFNKTYIPLKEKSVDNLLSESLANYKVSTRPKIFVCVSYPHNDSLCQNFFEEIIEYVNSKGLQTVNVKSLSGNISNLTNEIVHTLKTCNGILSLAFDRENGHTSPFVHIETSLGSSIGLNNLILVPSTVKKEGVLSNNQNIQTVNPSISLFAKENSNAVQILDNYLNEIITNYKSNFPPEIFTKYKDGLMRYPKYTKSLLTKFLKSFYRINKNEEINISRIFVKNPLVTPEQELSCNNLLSTPILIEGSGVNDIQISSLSNRDEKYIISKQQFRQKYISLLNYIMTATPQQSNGDNTNDLAYM